MANTTGNLSFKKRRPPQLDERTELCKSLTETQVRIRQAYGGFNNCQDSDLVESYVYEINALQSRYNYLLRRVKALNPEP